jgi:hypothetical protein
MDKYKHPSLKVMAVHTFKSAMYAKPYIEQTEYYRDINNSKKDGTNFLNHDPPGKFTLWIYGLIICDFG